MQRSGLVLLCLTAAASCGCAAALLQPLPLAAVEESAADFGPLPPPESESPSDGAALPGPGSTASERPANRPPPPSPSTLAAGRAQPLALSLRDAVAQSLENSDTVRVIGNTGVVLTSTTLLDPSIADARARVAEATFDPRVDVGYIGSRINEPPSSFFGPGIPAGTRRDEGNFTAALTKPWATGGSTSISYNPPLSYLFFPTGTSGAFNPAYETAFVLDARQPLLRGAGVPVNVAPIRIAQLRVDQETWQVKLAAMQQIRSVEEAYWTLQAATVARQSIEAVLPLAEETVRIQTARFESEQITKADLARAEAQREEFRQRLVRNQLIVRTSEIRLRNMLAWPAQDQTPLVPVDPPLQQDVPLDVERSTVLALDLRPDLMQQRLQLEVSNQELIVAENGVLPRLDLQAQYKIGGLADRLDDSLDQAMTFQYADWTLGTTFSMPLGNRAPLATRDEMQLRAARARVILQQLEENVRYQITENITAIQATWKQFTLARQRVVETQQWLEISRQRFSYPPPNESSSQDQLTVLLVDYQQALQTHLDATADAARLLAEYNSLHARLEEAQGTLLSRRKVWLSSDRAAAFGGDVPSVDEITQMVGHSLPGQSAPQTGRYQGLAPTTQPPALPGSPSAGPQLGRYPGFAPP